MTVRQLVGDCRVQLATLEAGSVQACVTSPPYYGLRSYQTPDLVWGGDAGHEHKWGIPGHSTQRLRNGLNGTLEGGKPAESMGQVIYPVTGAFCACGAWLGSLGLEPNPTMYVEHIVECFRHVRRVLRDDSTLWINLGDSYAGSGKGPSGSNGVGGQSERQGWEGSRHNRPSGGLTGGKTTVDVSLGGQAAQGYKPKDLLMIPFRVAMALQADGWYLRSVIPWLKRNSMPESVTDRPSTSVEYIFMLSKSARYFYDADAIRVGLTQAGVQVTTNLVDKGPTLVQHFGAQPVATDGRINLAVGIAATILQFAEAQDDLRLLPLDAEVRQEDADSLARLDVTLMPVICRATAHAVRFARQDISAEQFLGEINRLRVTLADGNRLHKSGRVTLFDRAGVNEDCDATIGVKDSGKVGQVEWFQRNKDTTPTPRSDKQGALGKRTYTGFNQRWDATESEQKTGRNRRNGDWFFESWQGLMLDEADDPLALVVNPQPFKESHFATFAPKLVEPMVKASTRPGDVILDPFGGSGTVGLVADRLGRNAVLVDLKPEYSVMAVDRLTGDAPLFVQLEAPA